MKMQYSVTYHQKIMVYSNFPDPRYGRSKQLTTCLNLPNLFFKFFSETLLRYSILDVLWATKINLANREKWLVNFYKNAKGKLLQQAGNWLERRKKFALFQSSLPPHLKVQRVPLFSPPLPSVSRGYCNDIIWQWSVVHPKIIQYIDTC